MAHAQPTLQPTAEVITQLINDIHAAYAVLERTRKSHNLAAQKVADYKALLLDARMIAVDMAFAEDRKPEAARECYIHQQTLGELIQLRKAETELRIASMCFDAAEAETVKFRAIAGLLSWGPF